MNVRLHEGLFTLGLAALLLVAPQGRGGGRRAQTGDPPQAPARVAAELPPPAAQPLSPPSLVHSDRRGWAERTLLLLRGIEGYGFGAVWRDTRDGSPGLYFTRLDSQGRIRAAERPLAVRSGERPELSPAIDLDRRGQAALAWLTPEPGADPGVHVRIVRHDGTLQGGETFVPVPKGRLKAGGRRALEDLDAEPLPTPAVVVGREGDAFLSWTFGGRVFLQQVDSGGALRELQLIDTGEAAAEGAPFLVAGPTGPELCVWNTDQGIRLRRIDRQRALAVLIGGPGRALRVQPVRVEGHSAGWWLLVEWGEHVLLRRLGEAGERVGLDRRLLERPFGQVDLAVWSQGVAVLSQPRGEWVEGVFEGGPFRLQLYSHDGREALGEPFRFPGPEAGARAVLNPRVAGAGERLMVAWAERRPAGTDVYFRLLEAGESEWGPEQRLTTDSASAHQRAPRVAATGGERAVVVWQDHRDGAGAVWARVYSSQGAPLTGELSLPAQPEDRALPDGGALAPQVAMAPDGSFAVMWGRGESSLEVQVLGPDGAPIAVVATVNRAVQLDAGFRLIRQERYRSWLAAWSMALDGIFVRRIRGDGVPLGKPVLVQPAPTAARPALAELEDGQVIVVFEDGAPGRPRRLAGRFLTPELGPASPVFDFAIPPEHSARAPDVALGAPDRPGSLLLTWISGDAGRVVAQLLAPDAAPLSRIFVLSAGAGVRRAPSATRLVDGSWVVAWEDDASGRPHVYARRIRSGATELGPVRLFSRVTRAHRVSGHEPSLAAVKSGLFIVGSDAQRGRGYDVWARVVGPGFDKYAPGAR